MGRRNPMRRPYPIVGTPWYALDLAHGHVALIDAEDVSLVVDWSPVFRSGYVVLRRNNGQIQEYLHRILLGISGRGWSVVADHINRDGLDNRRCNLRVATMSQNAANRAAISGKASKFKGVRGEAGRWMAIANKLHIGTFATEEEAARAYDKAALAQFGEFARLNFPAAA